MRRYRAGKGSRRSFNKRSNKAYGMNLSAPPRGGWRL